MACPKGQARQSYLGRHSTFGSPIYKIPWRVIHVPRGPTGTATEHCCRLGRLMTVNRPWIVLFWLSVHYCPLSVTRLVSVLFRALRDAQVLPKYRGPRALTFPSLPTSQPSTDWTSLKPSLASRKLPACLSSTSPCQLITSPKPYCSITSNIQPFATYDTTASSANF